MNIQQISAAINSINKTISHLERCDSSDTVVRAMRIELRKMYADLNKVRREERRARVAIELQKEIKRNNLAPVLKKGGD